MAGQAFRRLPLVAALLLLLAACAQPGAQRPAADAASAEREKRLVGQDYLIGLIRLAEVEGRIRRAAVPLCDNRVKRAWGLGVVRAATPEGAAIVEKLVGTGEPTTIMTVEKGGAAERAGAEPGDVIVAVDGVEVRGDRAKLDTLVKEKSDGAEFRMLRGGRTVTMRIAPDLACYHPVQIVPNDVANAMADGDKIVVTTAMLDIAQTDSELALVITHELAHNLLGHLSAKQINAPGGYVLGAVMESILSGVTRAPGQGANPKLAAKAAGAMAYSKELERDADRVGLTVMAAAGLDIAQAPQFWRRLEALASPDTITHATTHPPTAERFAALEAAVAEIKAKQAAGQKLLPDVTAAGKSEPAPAEPPAGM
jgi:membrane-associated protease RseP (regulator of RpoE activity)